MQRLLVLNLFIAMLWPILNGAYTLRALFIGFLFGFVLMSIVQRKYGYYTAQVVRFTVYVLYAILLSNLRLAAIVFANISGAAPKKLRPGIVAVPLALTDPFDITILATVITLTPGTLSVDLGKDSYGQLWRYGVQADDASEAPQRPQSASARDRSEAALLVHAIDIADPQAFRAEIKRNFERPLIELRRIVAELDVTQEDQHE